MINFQPLTLADKARYEAYLFDNTERGCEYSFANLYLWGRQQAAEIHDHLVLFSQFNRRTVYPFPVGTGEKRPVLDAIIHDAKARGIPCRITGLDQAGMELIEKEYPGQFRFHCDRDSYDYIYDIHDLADLKGRKYQKKRNHYNRFRQEFPYCTTQPLSTANLAAVREMVEQWYEDKLRDDPSGDYHMERSAINKALAHYEALGLDGLVLLDGEQVLAVTMGSPLSENTFDIHFEKARQGIDGAYAVINCEFARYLRSKYPALQYLNREDDLGLEGLRKAKLSYCPHHLVEKCWACLLEDGYDY
jgi:hypothetical protein